MATRLLELLSSGWGLRSLVFGALLVALLPVAVRRLVDGDEGYILMAARLVSEGHRPYADFFCPQMPGLPYVFGLWFKVTARNWTMARNLCGVVAALTGLCVFELAWRGTGKRRWALIAAGIYVSHAFVLGWLTIAKTYGLTAMFATAGCLALTLPRTRASLLCGGLCFALAGQMRLYAVVLVALGAIVLGVGSVKERGTARKVSGTLFWYLGGACLGGFLLVPSLLANTEAWWLGVVRFHGMREAGQNELVGQFAQKWATARSLLPLTRSREPAQIQFAVVLAVAVGARVLWLGRGFRVVGLAWTTLFVVSLLPTPTHAQYFCVLVPLLIVDAVFLLAWAPGRLGFPIALLGLVIFANLGRHELRRYTTTGLDVPGVWTTDRVPRWQLSTLRKVAQAIDAQDIDEGASWWPGYFVATKASIVRGLANDFGFRIADRLTLLEKLRYHVVSHADVAAMIQSRAPRLFVQGNWAATPPADQLPSAGYSIESRVQNVTVWVAAKLADQPK